MARQYLSIFYIVGDTDPTNSEGIGTYNTTFLNSTSGKQFICTDPTPSAQVWQQMQPYAIVQSWTPALTGTVIAGSTTYSTQVGKATNFGDLAIAWFNIAWSSTTATGNATVTGLPFSCMSSVGVTFTPAWTNFSLPVGSFVFMGNVAVTTISFATLNLASTPTALTVPAAGSISGSFIYPAGS